MHLLSHFLLTLSPPLPHYRHHHHHKITIGLYQWRGPHSAAWNKIHIYKPIQIHTMRKNAMDRRKSLFVLQIAYQIGSS